MPVSQSRRWWLLFGGFIVACILVVTLARWHKTKNKPPSLPHLANCLESQLNLYPLPAAKSGDPASGIYLCRRHDRLYNTLPQCRHRDFLPQWRGVVLLSSIPASDEMFAQTLRDWGDMALVLDGFLVFGDPDLIADILHVYKH